MDLGPYRVSRNELAFVYTIVYTCDMTTRTVSIRNFRENLTQLLKEAQENNIHFVVMRHSKPVAHVTPVTNGDTLEELRRDVATARKQAKEGETFTAKESRAMLGL